MTSPSVCLVGGTGRSGTTVTARLFSTHPEIAYVDELRFVIDPGGLLDLIRLSEDWSPAHADVALRRLSRMLRKVSKRSFVDLALSRLDSSAQGARLPRTLVPAYANRQATKYVPGFDALCEEFLSSLTTFTFSGRWIGVDQGAQRVVQYTSPQTRAELVSACRGFLQRVVYEACQHANASHYLEKNTHNILWFDRILELMPNAKLVHVVRDPRDSLVSMLDESWAPNTPEGVATYLADIHAQWERVRAACPDVSWIEIRLEDLITETGRVVNEVCDFWGLSDFDFSGFDLSRGNTGRWRSDPRLAGFDIGPRMAALVDEYGYEE